MWKFRRELASPTSRHTLTAQRELTEETGYTAGTMEQIARFFPAPGILDEEMFVFVATELVAGEPKREPYEEIENLLVSMDEALAMIELGEIKTRRPSLLCCYSAA